MTTALTVAPTEFCRASAVHSCRTAPFDLQSIQPDFGRYSKETAQMKWGTGDLHIYSSSMALWR